MRTVTARSSLGHRFVCHLGDFFGEYPFYTPSAFVPELELCAAWLRGESRAIAFDVGANVGFWSTQLAQMVGPQLWIAAFEPVPGTFCKLTLSVETLGLESRVQPVAAALSDEPGVARLSVNPAVSGYAQVSEGTLNPRVGDRTAWAPATTLDDFVASSGTRPTFLKIDVEGSEVRVLRGARGLLSGVQRPALLFEFNPLTLGEVGASPAEIAGLLGQYVLHYVDDFEGQRRPFGDSISSLGDLGRTCNLFAVPNQADALERFAKARDEAARRIAQRR
jgi:FkbM family methyltransferase